MEEKPAKKMTEEEIAREIQAAEEFGMNLDDDEEGDVEYVEDLNEKETEIYEAIVLENHQEWVARATALKLTQNYEGACQIIKLLIMKLSHLLKDPLHERLAISYYLMGKL